MPAHKIVIVEDDRSILTGLEYALEKEGYTLAIYQDGAEGYSGIRQSFKRTKDKPDLIILDIMLPNKTGYEICQQLRADKINTPIIMLTAKSQEADKIKGLLSGADDYITKPFSIKELLARVQAILRRSFRANDPEKSIKIKLHAECSIDLDKHEIIRGRKKTVLADKEAKLLRYFINNEGRVVTREELLENVWNYENEVEFPTTRTVDNYIVKIRQLIEPDPEQPQHLKTIYRAGYKFTSNP